MIVTHKIATKVMSIKADIARIDELYPDETVKYVYIGMVSPDEGEPLNIYFNELIGDSTILEPWDSFDREKYAARITNFAQLVTDMGIVVSTGVSKVEKITPTGGILVFAGIINTTKIAASKDVGNWAITGGKLYAQQGNLMHSLWFENIGLPPYGKAYDEIARGWYDLQDGELQLVVYNEGYPEHVDVLFSNADRIADRVLKLEGIPEVADIQLYEVAGASKKRIGQKLKEEDTMGKIGQDFKEEDKIALLMKYGGNDYLRFVSTARADIYVSNIDLLVKPEIEALKNSGMSIDDKVIKAKQIAMADAMEQLEDIKDTLGDVSISFDSLEADIDNMDWDGLLTPEEGE